MSLSVGIVGLPNVGKSTLFNALLKKRAAHVANYPFTTVEPNVGVVVVPDERLEKLAELVAKSTSEESRSTSEVLKKPPIVPAVVEFVDIAGLVKGASTGAGLGNQFLSHIREVDAIVHVLRDFKDDNIVREGSTDPIDDKITVLTELGLADLQVLEKLIIAQEKEARANKDPFEQTKLEVLNALKEELNSGEIKVNFQLADERVKDWYERLPLITIKPVLDVFNVLEGDYAKRLEEEELDPHTMIISAKLEEELAGYSEEERKEYLQSMGIAKTGLERLIVKAYGLLGLISFFTTTGKKQVRAWTLRRGETALRASGVIHTDFLKGFIRAQVIEYDKLIEAGSYTVAKQKGWIRMEGKDYVIKDGDVVEFLVSN